MRPYVLERRRTHRAKRGEQHFFQKMQCSATALAEETMSAMRKVGIFRRRLQYQKDNLGITSEMMAQQSCSRRCRSSRLGETTWQRHRWG